MKSQIIYVFATSFLFNFILSQLSQNDIIYMTSTITSIQDDSSTCQMAVESLLILGAQVDKKKICREIDLSKDEPSLSLVSINNLVNCKVTFDSTEVAKTSFEGMDLNRILRRALLLSKLKIKIDYKAILKAMQPFKTKSEFYSQSDETEIDSVYATSKALRILKIVHDSSKKIKAEVIAEIKSLLADMHHAFQNINDEMGLFTENGIDNFKLNHAVVEAFEDIKSISEYELLNSYNQKILNYFLENKYSYTSLEKIYYLVHSLSILSKYPIVQFEKNTIFFDETDNNELGFKVQNLFGAAESKFNLDIKYSPQSDSVFNKNTLESDDSTDLPDEIEETKPQSEYSISFAQSSSGKLAFKDIKQAGLYPYTFKINFVDPATGFTGSIKKNIVVRAISKVKVAYLKLSVTNTSDNSDNKENKIEFPKRSFRNIKATQNSIIKLKVKLNTSSNKFEQFFLRLKHNEISKVATGFSSEYNSSEGYHIIHFDMADHNAIEAYDGMYEMTLMISDPGLDNPILWNFGKMEIKFNKPLDPLNTEESFKNVQKPKIEHSFEPEQQQKTSLSSYIFTGIILIISLGYLKYLKSIRINFDNFPKTNKINLLFAFLFVFFIIAYAYILFLFWVQLNILQTLSILAITTILGSFFIFKTLVNVQIDI